MHHETFSRHFLNYFQSGLFTKNTEHQKLFGSIHASFRKWFIDRNAPTRAYTNEPCPWRCSLSLAGKIIHPMYPAYVWLCCVLTFPLVQEAAAEGMQQPASNGHHVEALPTHQQQEQQQRKVDQQAVASNTKAGKAKEQQQVRHTMCA